MTDFWERAAQSDPLWAILSDPSKRGRKWQVEDFFETGRREISLLLYQLHRLGHFPGTGRALDFGCGIGRLTQALASTFDEVVGVDVSKTMIQIANTVNPYPTVRFVLNQSDSLSVFGAGEFDFVYSDIVLQHLEPQLSKKYLSEFVRVLAPEGVAVFQLPSHKRASSEMSARPVHMHADSYRASLTLAGPPSLRLEPGESMVVEIDVRNDSAYAWDQRQIGPLRAGNHWRSESGVMLIQDDGRANLPAMMQPGEGARVVISVRAPDEPGRYICELDLVHEAISWFGDLGSATLRLKVDATATPSAAIGRREAHTLNRFASRDAVATDIYALLPPGTGEEVSDFPMHGVPRNEVLELVHDAGAAVFHVEDDERGGPEWHSYKYYVVTVSLAPVVSSGT
jgi:SAM-dependent methyltransferase